MRESFPNEKGGTFQAGSTATSGVLWQDLKYGLHCQSTRDNRACGWRWGREDKKGPDSAGLRGLSKGSLIPYPTGTMEHLKGFHQRKGRDVDKTRLTFWKEQCGCIAETGHLKSSSRDIGWEIKARDDRNESLDSNSSRTDEKNRNTGEIFPVFPKTEATDLMAGCPWEMKKIRYQDGHLSPDLGVW